MRPALRSAPEGTVRIVHAPAKLNLFLEVLGRRPDGYHEIESLMVTVDLHDTLTFADDPSGALTLSVTHAADSLGEGQDVPTGPENLVLKAADALRRAAGTTRGASMTLEKRIPAQAGLGGGSSDASTTLTALNRLWETGFDRADLDALAAGLGSDVPFFLHAPAAVCRGRGERVSPVTLGGALHFVLVRPPFGISTPDVYRTLDVPEPTATRPLGPVLDALAGSRTDALGARLFNRLQTAATTLAPELSGVLDALASLSPSHLDGHLMSGSGSACFGLARNRDAAQDAARHLGSLELGRVRVVTCNLENAT